jgi:MFS family permease
VNPPARLLGNREDLQEEVPPGLSNKFLFLARLINFLAYVSVSNLRALFPKQGIEMGFSPTSITALLALAMLGQCATFLFLRNTGFWHYRIWPFLASTAAAALSFLVISRSPGFVVLAIPFMLAGVLTGVTYFSSIYYSMTHARAGVESAAWHESILSAGTMLGPIAGGTFAQAAHRAGAAPVVSAAFAALGLAVAGWFWFAQRSHLHRKGNVKRVIGVR